MAELKQDFVYVFESGFVNLIFFFANEQFKFRNG